MAYNPYYFSDSDSERYDQGSQDDSEITESERNTSTSKDGTSEASSSRRPQRSLATSSAESQVSFRFSQRTSASSDWRSVTSYDHDPSEASSQTSSSDGSIISLTESLRAQMYKEEYGRELNNYSDVYRLPADEEEWDRLEKQHRMFIDFTGEKYPPPMAEVLQSTIPREKKVLDLGAGDGSWIKDVARDFPLCEAVAVDLVPMIDSDDMPDNLRSEVDDINLGLQHFYDQFDVVHVRLVSAGVRDYYRLIEHISRIVRPGGLIEIAEFDLRTYDRAHKRINITLDVPPKAPYWSTHMAYMHRATQQAGGDVDAATHLYRWIANHVAFENAHYREIWLPAVPGHDEGLSEEVESVMRSVIMNGVRAGRPMLLGSGIPAELYEFIEAHADQEIQAGLIPQYTRLQCVFARKRHGVVLGDLDDGGN